MMSHKNFIEVSALLCTKIVAKPFSPSSSLKPVYLENQQQLMQLKPEYPLKASQTEIALY